MSSANSLPNNKWLSGLSMLKRSPTALIGLIIVSIVILSGIFAPWISPYDPIKTNLYSRLKPPSTEHWFGTDKLGRDVLSRIIWGARVSLKVGVISVGIGMVIGVMIGLIGGYFGGITEKLIFSVVDLMLSVPPLLLALAIVATLGPGIGPVMTAVGISLIPVFARVARGSVLTVKEQNYVLSARALGASHLDIMLRHILPNIVTPVIIMATLYCAFAIIMEAALSFLGIGIQPPDPTWGEILSHGQQQIRTAAWISTFSGLAITLTVLGFNLLGDGLRDLMDPNMKHVIQAK
ncbi:MAG: ABC transporter permease [Desulfobacterales bacterium]|nr:MAG: ABC transporter permease [Desulfobacterales bacterium]